MLHSWHSALDRGDAVRTVFVDYAKAFDHVSHEVVLNKMVTIGINPWIVKWFHSFLYDRLYRVKIGKCYSNFTTFNGGLPQGTWSGPFAFLILINDLHLSVLVHKFVDDVTLTEIIAGSNQSVMQDACHELQCWSQRNSMNINIKKTHGMVFCPKGPHNDTGTVQINGVAITCVTSYKLLGVIIQSNLKWNEHVQYICSRASKCLFLLKQLRRANLPVPDLVYFYCTVIRPILEYACAVWHTSLSKNQSDCIEQIQKRALNIIYGYDGSYSDKLLMSDLIVLSIRRDDLCRKLFVNIMNDKQHCLHKLLPPQRRDLSESSVVTRLQQRNILILPKFKTNRFRHSFIMYCLDHFM